MVEMHIKIILNFTLLKVELSDNLVFDAHK